MYVWCAAIIARLRRASSIAIGSYHASLTGELTTDLHPAALAIEYQAELHSNDSDFKRFPGPRWFNPLA